MLKQTKYLLFTSLCSLLVVFAYHNVNVNCLGLIYEPDVPESLKS